MQIYQLKNRLKHLILAGFEDGEYQWFGNREQWQKVETADYLFEKFAI